MNIEIGRLSDIPTDHCLAVADGRAVVVRVGDNVRAFPNRCLHQDAPLAGGWVRDGVLSCPLHFWRYDADTGRQMSSSNSLTAYPIEVLDGVVLLTLPDEPPRLSLREQLLQRARDYDRAAAWENETGAPPPP